MKEQIQRFGKSLSGMVMPNIGAFIAWGFITALFIPTGWWPNERLGQLVGPMLRYLLPLLIAITAGRRVAGDRGGVIAAVAAMGVILGSDIPMFIGAMAIGPFAGWVIRKFDSWAEGRIPAGFEMLVNNFSVGILGIGCALIGFYGIGPVITTLTAGLSSGVSFMIEHGLLPLVAIFVEPAKVLFLNNAINHGIFSPIGIEQASQAGQSIMFLLETNPGPGVGVLFAYWAFAKGAAKSSAPGAIIIQFFGGIHEIYFPYVLMRPLIILAPIAGSAAAICFYSAVHTGLTAVASPGSILAVLAMAPKGQTLLVLLGVLIAALVSFVVAMPIVRSAHIAEVKAIVKPNGKVIGGTTAQPTAQHTVTTIRKVVFACDAGMGSSAMGATRFRRRIASLQSGVQVTNSSVDAIPEQTDIVVCQAQLAQRATASAPTSEIVVIENFLADAALDHLFERIEQQTKSVAPTEQPATTTVQPATTPTGLLTLQGIRTGLPSVDKQTAIRAAGELLAACGYVDDSYADAMLAREEVTTTYLGMGIAIPHGTSDAKSRIQHSGIVVMQYPEGVPFGEERAQLIIGIAGVGDEHIEILSQVTSALEDEEVLEQLKTTTNPHYILEKLSNNQQ
jgi:PTS system mannitol-specific IIC component